MRLLVIPGVFRPISDSRLLADVVARHVGPGSRVLDVCTGSGYVAVRAALAGAEVTAVDVSRRAAACARINGRLNGVRVAARVGSLFEPVGGRRFDVVSANPPYVPAEEPDLPRRGLRRAWDAGLDGRALLDRLIAEAPAHLAPGGALLVTHSTIIGEEETLRRMRSAGLAADVVERVPGRLGPLMRARRDHLVERGLLPPGQDTEEVLILRGILPPPWPAGTTTPTASTSRRGGRTTTSTATSTTSSTTRTSTP